MGMRCTDLCQLQECDNSENNKEDDDKVVSDYETENDDEQKSDDAKIPIFVDFFLLNSTDNNETIEINILLL